MKPSDFDKSALLPLLQQGCTITFPYEGNPYMRGDLADLYIVIGTESAGGLGRYLLNEEGLDNAINDKDLFPVPKWSVNVRAIVTINKAVDEYDVSLDWQEYDFDVNSDGEAVIRCDTPVLVDCYTKEEAIALAKNDTPDLFSNPPENGVGNVEIWVDEDNDDDVFIAEY